MNSECFCVGWLWVDVGGCGWMWNDNGWLWVMTNECGWELVVESRGNWFCEMDVMSCVDIFFCFPSVVKTVWLADWPWKQRGITSPTTCGLEWLLSEKSSCHSAKLHTHWTSHSAHVHGCIRCQNESDQTPKNVGESRFLCLHAMVHLLPKCWTRTAQGLHTDPEATCGFVQMKVQKNLQPFNNQPFNQGVPLLPQEDWPQDREKQNSPSNPWKGNVCSKLPWKVQWWPSIILLHGWGGILCFDAVCIWLFTLKQASNHDGSHNQKLKHQYNHADWDAKRWATRKNNGHQGSAMSRQHWTVSSVHGGSTR